MDAIYFAANKQKAMNNEAQYPGLRLTRSYGRGKYGKTNYFIRPDAVCDNRSRKVGGFTDSEINEAVAACVKKWFTPLQAYKIQDYIIYSNSPENARREWQRVCAFTDRKLYFEIAQLNKK